MRGIKDAVLEVFTLLLLFFFLLTAYMAPHPATAEALRVEAAIACRCDSCCAEIDRIANESPEGAAAVRAALPGYYKGAKR